MVVTTTLYASTRMVHSAASAKQVSRATDRTASMLMNVWSIHTTAHAIPFAAIPLVLTSVNASLASRISTENALTSTNAWRILVMKKPFVKTPTGPTDTDLTRHYF